jgi:hypothetical protein
MCERASSRMWGRSYAILWRNNARVTLKLLTGLVRIVTVDRVG